MTWLVLQSITLIAAALGLVLAIAGLAGTRAGEGQRCRSCGYDVADILDEQDLCPECGRSIAGERDVVSGSRLRRPRLIIAGVLLLVPASAVGWYFSTMVQPLSARPSWVLGTSLRLGSTSANSAAARELLARWRLGDIDVYSRSSLLNWGLSAWVDGHEARGFDHGEVIRFAATQGRLSERDIDAFAEQLLDDAGDSSNTLRQRVALTLGGDFGQMLRPRLEAALDEPDRRQAAALFLLDDVSNTPSEALLDAAFDSLATQAGPNAEGAALDRIPLSIEARRALRYLSHNADRCASRLRRSLEAEDPQTRLLAAAALAEARDQADAEAIGHAIADALIPNTTPGDAQIATRLILRVGPGALDAAIRATTDPASRARLRELEPVVRGSAPLPPHLERLVIPRADPRPRQPAP